MEHVPLLKPVPTRPVSQTVRSEKKKTWGLPIGLVAMVKDQLTVSSWLAVGACLQSALFLAAGRIAFVPAFMLVLYRVVNAALIANGSIPNRALEGVIFNKFSVHYPDADGKYRGKGGNKDIVVLHIGAKVHHPMGMFAPGAKDLGDYFGKMVEDCEARSEEYGLLGATSYIVSGEESAANETMAVLFFESVEGLHKFAHDPLHREGWNWWNKNLAGLKHISIWHEVFRSPAGNWEGIYVNSKPRGLAATTVPVTLEKGDEAMDVKAGERAFYRPIVDARKGPLKTSAGRISATGSDAKEHEKYGGDPYENYGRLSAV